MNPARHMLLAAMLVGVMSSVSASQSALSSSTVVWAYYQEPSAGMASGGLLGTLWRMGIGLAIVLALFFSLFWIYRTYIEPRLNTAAASSRGAVQIIGHTALGPRFSIYVIRAINRILVIGTSPHTMTVLTDVLEGEVHSHDHIQAATPVFARKFRECTARIKRS